MFRISFSSCANKEGANHLRISNGFGMIAVRDISLKLERLRVRSSLSKRDREAITIGSKWPPRRICSHRDKNTTLMRHGEMFFFFFLSNGPRSM